MFSGKSSHPVVLFLRKEWKSEFTSFFALFDTARHGENTRGIHGNTREYTGIPRIFGIPVYSVYSVCSVYSLRSLDAVPLEFPYCFSMRSVAKRSEAKRSEAGYPALPGSEYSRAYGPTGLRYTKIRPYGP